VAKHVVAAGYASKALVQVAYAIGFSEPVSFLVETFGTETVDTTKLQKAVNRVFDMRPKAIIERLDLLRPQYSQTAAYGHFGRSEAFGFSWEKLSFLDALKSHF
jgi:S-adenosylmethionine synthetase